MTASNCYYNLSDMVPADGRAVYVPRPEMEILKARLKQPERFPIACIRACRQAGKTSLIINELEPWLRSEGWFIPPGHIDLRAIQHLSFDNFGSLAAALATELEMAGALSAEAFEAWKTRHCITGATSDEVSNPAGALADLLIAAVNSAPGRGLALILDELDVINKRVGAVSVVLNAIGLALTKGDVKGKLLVITATLLDPVEMAAAANPSDRSKYGPMTVALALNDFPADWATVATLAKGLPKKVPGEAIVSAVLAATGGQPYLTNLLLHNLAETLRGGDTIGEAEKIVAVAVDRLVDLVRQGRQPEKFHFDYASDHLNLMPQEAIAALRYYRTALEEYPAPPIERPASERIGQLLEATGLMRARGGDFTIRSPIYAGVFGRPWIDAQTERISKADASAYLHRTTGPLAIQRADLPLIAVLNCGGTLGMEVGADGMVREPANLEVFFQRFSRIGEIARVHSVPGLTVRDSANMAPDDWEQIAERLYQTWRDFRDQNLPLAGFVVAFGTDTLAHAATGVALALGPALPVPVVFTGAQAPHTAVHGDAAANLLRAATVVAQLGGGMDQQGKEKKVKLPEVVVAFGDHLYRAVQVEKRDDFNFYGFHSPGHGPIGVIGEKVLLNPGYQPKTGLTAPPESWRLTNGFDPRVLLVSQYPGMPPLYLEAILEKHREQCERVDGQWRPRDPKSPSLIRGIVIESLGVGNLPTRGGISLINFIKDAETFHIPVAITSRIPIKSEFAAAYAPARAPQDAGAVLIGSMTTAAVVTKMMWLLAQEKQEANVSGLGMAAHVKKMLTENVVGEISDS
ncbi:MAG: asparaginase [Rhodospirillales bacterium]|nr:asparaginase [Rhodospirillales bacterium]